MEPVGKKNNSDTLVAIYLQVTFWIAVNALCHELGMLVQHKGLQYPRLGIVSDHKDSKLVRFDLSGGSLVVLGDLIC